MNNYHNYYQQFENQIKTLKPNSKILVHVCCGVCSMYPLELLSKYFDITIYYENSNIYPKEEYDLRLEELIRYLKTCNKPFKVVVPEFNETKHLASIWAYRNSREGGVRCLKCYGLRMDKCAIYAKENNFDYFTTVMSISPHKNSRYINSLGQLIEEKRGVKFLYSDFKKNQGQLKNNELNQKFQLYRQDYCGCIYSLKQRKLE